MIRASYFEVLILLNGGVCIMKKLMKFKNEFNFKKTGFILGVLLLTIGLGSGMNMAFAGQDAGSLLANWFGAKKTASEQEIAKAITEEKDRLMGELKIALQDEKKRAEEELAAFTIEEIDRRTSALQEYAETLKANMKTDLTEEKELIIVDLDAKYNQAIEELNKPTTPIESAPPPEPGVDPDLKSDVETEKDEITASKPGADEGTSQNPVPEPEAEVKPEPESKPE